MSAQYIRRGKEMWLPVSALALLALIALWLWSPWPTKAAHYVWRHWRAPELTLFLDRSDAPLAMEIGNTYFGATVIGPVQARYDLALAGSAFTHALALEPDILWGHYSLARIAFAEGDLETALVEINKELEANPENLRALYVRGLIYGYRLLPGDLALAEADFARFTEWAPTEWAGYNDLAWILAKEGEYGEISSVIHRAFERAPDGKQNPWLWNALGVAELNEGHSAQASEAFAKALQYAQTLSLAEWRKAYTGNDPAGAEAGRAAFVGAIEANLKAAKAGGVATPHPAL